MLVQNQFVSRDNLTDCREKKMIESQAGKGRDGEEETKKNLRKENHEVQI